MIQSTSALISSEDQTHIQVDNLTLRYGDRLIQENLNFEIKRKDIFVIMGGSGCGKSTLLKHMFGLLEPAEGDVRFNGVSLWQQELETRQKMMQRFGISYQAGAIISSLTLAENIAMPLELYTKLSKAEISELVSLKLMMVGLAGFEDYYSSEISGGMLKRAALARAIALEPEVLFFDEPSAGLDPLSARNLDELILTLSDSLNTTIVIVTHELASIFAIGSNSVFLDAQSKTMLTTGDPNYLLKTSKDARVQRFLRRGDYQQPKETI
ncbi:ATP-binding cassette domain-containing protein [Alginatibacterium sediminis]|uniref:ATP-binding cassette domain-containing protein n=1 Tax=Alginatibacterium sediminis TaxID=2164068 RepID=A0A420EBM5_9ALTE|nr:ATP-binding cassette domain-containing protein [Alginatibacterium sediminis]RKF18100.1 ATP-binding cassette domain-containing protein [Alginatibacterium sediminis]